MKRTLTHIALVLTTLLALSSCSHNNGDIGYWFGLWHLDAIEVDGVPDDGYDGNYYFLFQGKVFCLRYVIESTHESLDAYAQWQESDDKQYVTINFIDNRFSPYFGDQIPLNYLSTVSTLKVDTLTSTTIVLTSTLDDATTVTYRLSHWE